MCITIKSVDFLCHILDAAINDDAKTPQQQLVRATPVTTPAAINNASTNNVILMDNH